MTNEKKGLKRVIVTGGSGFIGTNLVDLCLKENYVVLNLDNNSPKNVLHKSVWESVNVNDIDHIQPIIKDFQPNIVFHLAARTDLDGKNLDDYSTNTQGLSNLISVLKQNNGQILRVIFASTKLVCRNGYLPQNEKDYCPTTNYGKSKMLGEQIIRKEAANYFPWVIVRPTSVWGPWFGPPYKQFFECVRKGNYFHPKVSGLVKSYGYVGNIVYQMLKMSECPISTVDKKTFYLSDYEPLDIKVWAEIISKEFGASPIREIPLWILNIGAKIGDLLKLFGYKNPPLSSFRLNNILTKAIFDTESIKSICGELPFDLQQGVKQTIDWMLENISE